MKKYISGLAVALLLAACDSFLDVEPKGMVIPRTVEDYDEILNNRSAGSMTNTLLMSPEVSIIDDEFLQHSLSDRRAYCWADYQYLDNENDDNWNGFYARIAACNEIIENIDLAESKTRNEKLRKEVKGQACAERAKCYFALVNLYAKPYSEKNLGELGVPLLLKDDIKQKSARATVGEVYGQICKDLAVAQDLVPELVDLLENNRASRQAVYAFKAKVYLFMNRVDSARTAIDKAFEKKPVLIDYQTKYRPNGGKVWRENQLPKQSYRNEEVVWNGDMHNNFSNFRVFYTPELEALYDQENDLRYKMCASRKNSSNNADYPATRYYNRFTRTFAVAAGEMYLLRAECYARQGEYVKAMEFLEELRKHRYLAGSDYSITASDAADALSKVKEERLREVAFTGLHWLDLRRYQAYGEETGTFRRTTPDGSFELKPHDNRYTCSIPRYVIGKNDRIEQNPR